MKGTRVVCPEKGRAELEGFDIPLLNPDQVLVETEYSVISPGTERAFMMAMENTAGRFPYYPGYAACGTVIDTGSEVTALRKGDRVLGGGHGSHTVRNESGFHKITDSELKSEEAAFTEIAIMSMQGVRKARIELGESVAVMGQGLMGLFAAQFARANGGMPVVALDYNKQRLELSRELGADHGLSPESPDFQGKFEEACGGGAHAVIEVTGSPSAMHQALNICADRGRIVALGCARGMTDGINFYADIHKTGISIIGAHNCVRPKADSYPGYWTAPEDRDCFLGLLAGGRIQVKAMISEIASPDKAEDAFGRLAEGKLDTIGFVFDWKRGHC